VGGVGWIRGVEWVPYQRRTFVTPAFPGFTSGHSTFSRSAAEVLTELTGAFRRARQLHRLPGYLSFEGGRDAGHLAVGHVLTPLTRQGSRGCGWHSSHLMTSVAHRNSEAGRRAVAKAISFFDGTAVP
jgi:hypothetical protein